MDQEAVIYPVVVVYTKGVCSCMHIYIMNLQSGLIAAFILFPEVRLRMKLLLHKNHVSGLSWTRCD